MNIYQREVEKAMNHEESSKNINVNLICPRFENAYIVDPSKSDSLRKSIKKNGLIQPINVIDIFRYIEESGYGPSYVGCDKTDEYLDRCIEYKNNLSEEEREKLETNPEYRDLMESLDRHIRYIISSGHRRFYAYISLLLNKPINNRSEWKQAYSEIRKAVRGDSEWKQIPSILIDSTEKEYAVYNDSNTTQRELTSFEIVVNAIDEMKKNGTWDKVHQESINTYVDNMNDRTVVRTITKCKREGINVTSREDLKSLGFDYFPIDSLVNKAISNYINENKQRAITVSTVRGMRRIFEQLDKEQIQKIYDGKLSVSEAKTIVNKPKSDAHANFVPGGTKFAQVSKTYKKSLKSIETLKNNISQFNKEEADVEEIIQLQIELKKVQSELTELKKMIDKKS